MLVSDTVWETPPRIPTLVEGQVHVWLLRIDSSERDEQDADTLSHDELAMVSRMSEKLKERFVARRGILRNILSHYLAVKPNVIDFKYECGGKPSLASISPDRRIQFNFAHSGELALCAIALNTRVGVDLEYKQPFVNVEQFVKRFFSKNETHTFSQLTNDDLRLDFFYNHWTAKEAFLKAQGLGLTRASLDQIKLSFEKSNISAVSAESQVTSSRWILYRLQPILDFAAALVVKEPEQKVFCWKWPESGLKSD